jgi:hypothetical protein
MKITVRIQQAEIIYEEPQALNNYPRLLTSDKYEGDLTKSQRLFDAITHLVGETIRLHKEQHKPNVSPQP